MTPCQTITKELQYFEETEVVGQIFQNQGRMYQVIEGNESVDHTVKTLSMTLHNAYRHRRSSKELLWILKLQMHF